MTQELVKKVQKLLDENHIYADVYLNGPLCVDISWGDWKHEHLRCDWLIKEHFNVLLNNTTTTEENGSDCYSAIHRYLIAE